MTTSDTDTKTDDILSPEMNMGGALVDEIKDLDVSGLEAAEFAEMIAEATSAFLPEGADPAAYKHKFCSISVPFLKLGGFEQLSEGMNLGTVVANHPYIGAIICVAGCGLGLYVAWPKQVKKETEAVKQAKRQAVSEQEALDRLEGNLGDEEGGLS